MVRARLAHVVLLAMIVLIHATATVNAESATGPVTQLLDVAVKFLYAMTHSCFDYTKSINSSENLVVNVLKALRTRSIFRNPRIAISFQTVLM
jgi:hypothetical protein